MLKLSYGVFIIKTVVLAFLVGINSDSQNTMARPNSFESPFVFNLCMLNVLDYYLVFESFLNKNVFESFVYIFVVASEFIASIQQIVLETTNMFFVIRGALVLYSIVCFFHIFFAIHVYNTLKRFYAETTLKIVGANTKIFKAYKYKQNLFVLGKLVFIQTATGLLTSFIQVNVAIGFQLLFRMIRLVFIFIELISIYYKPYDDIKTLKSINFIVFTADIGLLLLAVVLEFTKVNTSNGFGPTFIVLFLLTILFNIVVLYHSFKDYMCFGSGIKNALKTKKSKISLK